MTVAERKRLQWAREKEAAEKLGDFDPWGRPGAGAPPPKKPEVHVPDAELHTKEEKNLRAAVDEIEAKYAALLSQTASRHSPAARTRNHSGDDVHSKPSRQPDPVSPAGDDAEIRSSQGSVSKHRLEDKGNSRPNRKQQNRTDEQKERRGAPRGIERKPRPSRDEGKGDNREGRDYRDRRQEDEETRKVVEAREEPGERTAPGSQGPASGQTSMMIGQSAPDNSQFISKKEEEKKKWLAELDRQREEKRLQKQRERDERRAGVDDTWADRFVQQPPPRPSIRMQQQQQPTATQQLMAPDAAPTSGYRTESTVSGGRADSQNNEMPPPAMRSCMAIGGIAPNDDRIRDKKREEQRLWLEELNKQREEQREARMKLKDKTRASEETWADRFTHDPRETAAVDRSPRTEPPQTGSYHDNAGGRISSAPQPQPASTAPAADEDVTFIRGQNVYLDPVTRYELEQKRKKHLEYQAAVKAQIEEKERLKREERERKWREEMEEEAKLKAERDKLQRQLEAEENKHRQKEEARQRQVEQLKNMMDAEQERAKEQRMLNRLTTLQQGGHDIRGLKAHYEATTPRLHGVSVDPSTIPGLGGTSPRDNYHSNQRDNHYSNPPSYRGNMEAPSTKRSQEIATDTVSYDPYVEDRVLTPSRFRKPSQPHNDPSSPRREFATQTGDIAALIESLKKEISDVEIEYRPKPGDKASRNNNKQVHVKSADNKKQPDNRQRQGAPQPPPTKQSKPKQQKADGKPPTWNYQNPKKKAPVKQSEKDPFFEQKREEREEQRAKRERQLQYLVELNKQVIPTEKHSRLDIHTDGDLPNGLDTDRGAGEERSRKQKHAHTKDDPPVANGDVSHRSRSHRSRSPPAKGTGKYRRMERSQSPPVPAVRHKIGKNPAGDFETDYDVDAHNYYRPANGNAEVTPRVDEHGNVTAPVRDGDFVPIMRTQDVLDPSKAEEPVQLSRENTHIKKARQHYHENLHPADYGNQLEMYEDRQRQPAPRSKDPILNPGLVKDFPTARQDQILQQLSSLKQSLIQRQRELETCMSPSDFEKQV
nr:hypothetical protein BaRGS_012616 [Batillaria attramentaria]